MAIPVEMPRPGVTVEECLLVRWLRRKGERVAAGEAIAEIETDKATFELAAPGEGTLLEIFVEEGQTAPVYSIVGVIGEPGESVEAFRPQRLPHPAPPAAPQPAAAPPEEASPAAPPGRLSPRARRFAAEHPVDAEGVAGSGPGGRVLEDDLRRAYHGAPRRSAAAAELARQGYLAPPLGSGPAGMILASDMIEPGLRLSGVRERTAERMRISLAHSAQYTLNASAEAGALLRLRERIRAAHRESRGPDINLNELVMFAAVRALLRMPELNAEFIEGRLYQRRSVHLAFACQTPRGLLAPVVREAQRLSPAELAERVKLLARQAEEGSIAVEDLRGGTFTVSNLGALGIESFTPILNPPQVALLGVNAITLRPVRRGESIEFRDYIGLSLTCDHQVIDGAVGARFLQVLREQIENIEALAGGDL